MGFFIFRRLRTALDDFGGTGSVLVALTANIAALVFAVFSDLGILWIAVGSLCSTETHERLETTR